MTMATSLPLPPSNSTPSMVPMKSTVTRSFAAAPRVDFVERRALLAQRVEHGVEILVADARHRASRCVSSVTRLQLHFRQHFEHRGVLEVRSRAHGDRLDARAAGRD